MQQVLKRLSTKRREERERDNLYLRGGEEMKGVYVLLLLVAVVLALSGCTVSISTSGPGGTATASSSTAHLGERTKTAGCVAHGGLPDSACTPGAIFSSATVQKICTSGYASSVRNVPTSEKDQVYAEYGITHHAAGQYEVD